MNGKITAKKLVSKGGVVIAVIIAFIIFAIGAPSILNTKQYCNDFEIYFYHDSYCKWVQPSDLQLACLI